MSDTSYIQSSSESSESDSIGGERSITGTTPSSGFLVRQLIFHGIFLFFQVLSWISTCVAFAGIIFSGKIVSVAYDAYYDRIEFGGLARSYDDGGAIPSSNCIHAGKGYVAILSMAFVLIVLTVTLTILRAIGKAESIPFIRSNTKSVNTELICTLLSVLFFFISILVFGGGCYQNFQSADNVSVRPVGFAFTIVCFFLLIFCIPLIYFIRRDTTDESFQIIGNISANAGQAYVPPETGGFQGNPESAAQPSSYGTYQSV